MKRKLLIGLIVLLAALGLYFGWRYYQDAYLPDRALSEALEAQNALFRDIKPETALFPSGSEPIASGDPTGTEPSDAPEETGEAAASDPLAALKALNGETVGWLTVEGTAIDNPIVQAEDNSYYLKRGFDRKENNGLGCPFLDCRCKDGFRGFNAVVYGHDIPGKREMFFDVANYKDPTYLRAHPTGVLLDQDGVHAVRFFAYLTVPSDSKIYRVGLETEEDRAAYLDRLFAKAAYVQGQTAEALKQIEDLHLLLLSTCTYEYSQARGVLVGVIQ